MGLVQNTAGQCYNRLNYNTVRIAFTNTNLYGNSGLSDEFLQRAADNGYNYVCAKIQMHSGHSWSSLKQALINAFRRTDEFGLRFIPKTEMGSKWAIHWRHLVLSGDNPDIALGQRQ
jgi:hypothetical protein